MRRLAVIVLATTFTGGTVATIAHHDMVKRSAPVCHYRHTKSGQPLPDQRCTPGALNGAVSQATLASTICRAGYTATVRPPAAITGPEKKASAYAYRYRGSLSEAEFDHLIPLELGGAANNPLNLWLEPPSPGHQPRQGFANPKDMVEAGLNRLVCKAIHLRSHHAGSATSYLPLHIAQQLIVSDWTTALARARTASVTR
ncbi:MAG: hypothetical protein ABI140_01435 [Jatrophihabitantaceae bacterium]